MIVSMAKWRTYEIGLIRWKKCIMMDLIRSEKCSKSALFA